MSDYSVCAAQLTIANCRLIERFAADCSFRPIVWKLRTVSLSAGQGLVP